MKELYSVLEPIRVNNEMLFYPIEKMLMKIDDLSLKEDFKSLVNKEDIKKSVNDYIKHVNYLGLANYLKNVILSIEINTDDISSVEDFENSLVNVKFKYKFKNIHNVQTFVDWFKNKLFEPFETDDLKNNLFIINCREKISNIKLVVEEVHYYKTYSSVLEDFVLPKLNYKSDIESMIRRRIDANVSFSGEKFFDDLSKYTKHYEYLSKCLSQYHTSPFKFGIITVSDWEERIGTNYKVLQKIYNKYGPIAFKGLSKYDLPITLALKDIKGKYVKLYDKRLNVESIKQSHHLTEIFFTLVFQYIVENNSKYKYDVEWVGDFYRFNSETKLALFKNLKDLCVDMLDRIEIEE